VGVAATPSGGSGALSAGKTVVGLVLAGLGIYVVWEFVIPLLKAIKGVGGAVGDVLDKAGDAVGAVVDTASKATDTLLGLPSASWRAIVGGSSSFKPDPSWTPERASQSTGNHMQHGTSTTTAEYIATWTIALVQHLNMQEASEAQGVAFLHDINAPLAYPNFKKWLLEADPNAGQPVTTRAILMVRAGASLATPAITALYWQVNDMLKAGPAGFLDPGSGTSAVLIRIIWRSLFNTEPPITPARPWHSPTLF